MLLWPQQSQKRNSARYGGNVPGNRPKVIQIEKELAVPLTVVETVNTIVSTAVTFGGVDICFSSTIR